MLLDAAVRLAAEQGPAAVTMSAVARAVGAPSGSVYHRFPSHPALLAALWLRTLTGFHEDFLAAFRHEPAEQAPVAVARQVLSWARTHPMCARVLLYGPADFAQSQWPAEATAQLATANRRITKALAELSARLGRDTPLARELLAFVVIDLPHALVRRYLRGESIPPHADDMLVQCANALLARRCDS